MSLFDLALRYELVPLGCITQISSLSEFPPLAAATALPCLCSYPLDRQATAVVVEMHGSRTSTTKTIACVVAKNFLQRRAHSASHVHSCGQHLTLSSKPWLLGRSPAAVGCVLTKSYVSSLITRARPRFVCGGVGGWGSRSPGLNGWEWPCASFSLFLLFRGSLYFPMMMCETAVGGLFCSLRWG